MNSVLIIKLLIMMNLGSMGAEDKEYRKLTHHDSPVLFQVILNVKDMQSSVDFYTNVLELQLSYPLDMDDYTNVPFVRLESGGMRLSLHRGRTDKNNGQEPRISFMVNDIKSWEEYLKKQNVSMGPIRSPYTGVYVLDCKDPEGNVFHIEYHED